MKLRFRYLFMALGSLLVLSALFLLDPLEGAQTASWMLGTSRFVVAVAMVFFGYRAVTDYDEADGRSLHASASQSPTGAGLALVSRGLIIIAMAILYHSVSVAQTIPAQAPQHLPTLRSVQMRVWPTMQNPVYLAGLIEKESCITVKHSRCWNATSRLKTSREEGAGFGQITRAYYKDGSLRFDALAELKAKHPELAAWNWGNVYTRPDMQLLGIVLKIRDNFGTFRYIPSETERLKFALKSYNRGIGGVAAEIRACGLRSGCNPKVFAGNAGMVCTASTKAMPGYGGLSPCDISLKYVPGVIAKSDKYKRWFV